MCGNDATRVLLCVLLCVLSHTGELSLYFAFLLFDSKRTFLACIRSLRVIRRFHIRFYFRSSAFRCPEF
jgi:hypothetical protein